MTLIQLPIARHACAWTPHLAPGQIRAPGHTGYSKQPRQWVGTERPTIASVREDLGLRLHANVAGDIVEQSFIYKPSARLNDVFNRISGKVTYMRPLKLQASLRSRDLGRY